MAKQAKQIRVRALVTLSEGGNVYHPARTERDAQGGVKKLEGDVFTVDEDRAPALGDSVEVIGPVVEPAEKDAPKEGKAKAAQ